MAVDGDAGLDSGCDNEQMVKQKRTNLLASELRAKSQTPNIGAPNTEPAMPTTGELHARSLS